MRKDAGRTVTIPGAGGLLAMLVVAIAVRTSGEALEADGAGTETIDLPTLAELVVANDPALETLRRAIAAADFRIAASVRGRSPEVRIRYGETSEWSVPAPYTERSVETVTVRSSQNSSGLRTDATDGSSESTSTTESQSENETVVRETVRVITPDETGESIRETVTEASSGQWSGHGDEISGTGVTTSRDESGSFTTRMVSESVERLDYGQDAYGGSSHYAVQLRLFPRNPWIKTAERNRELALKDHAEAMLDAALQRAALSVAREHRAIQFMSAELREMQRHAALLELELAHSAEMKEAKSIAAADYHKRQAEALVYLSRIAELKRDIADANARLKTRAGLDENVRISYAGSLTPPHVDLDALDPPRLVELARPRHPGLSAVRSELSGIESEISAERAAGIPWLSFVSFDYGVDDAANGQTRDEWSVYAGVEVPIGVWLDGASRRALNDRLGSARREARLTDQQLALLIGEMCRSLAASQSEWVSFAGKTRPVRDSVEQQMAMMGDDDLAARRTRMALSDSLLAMDIRRLELARRTSDLLFNLCDTIGHDLGVVLGN